MRIINVNDDMIEFLIDPWSQQASVWQLNLKDRIPYKISDFENLKKHALYRRVHLVKALINAIKGQKQ